MTTAKQLRTYATELRETCKKMLEIAELMDAIQEARKTRRPRRSASNRRGDPRRLNDMQLWPND